MCQSFPMENWRFPPMGVHWSPNCRFPRFQRHGKHCTRRRTHPAPTVSMQAKNAIGQSVLQYVRIDLRTGSVQSLTDAPTNNDAGWWIFTNIRPDWSSDGRAVVLPGTFIKSKDNAPSRPCVAVVDLPSNTRTCVEVAKRVGQKRKDEEEGSHIVHGAQFRARR